MSYIISLSIVRNGVITVWYPRDSITSITFVGGFETVCKKTADDRSVQVRCTVGFNRHLTPHQERGPDKTVKWYEVDQCCAQALDDQHGRERQPVRKPPIRDGHPGCRERPSVVDRNRHRRGKVTSEHDRDRVVRRVREPYEVAEQHGPAAVLRHVHSDQAREVQKQLKPADAGPGLGPAEEHVPRFVDVPQRNVHRVHDVNEGCHKFLVPRFL